MIALIFQLRRFEARRKGFSYDAAHKFTLASKVKRGDRSERASANLLNVVAEADDEVTRTAIQIKLADEEGTLVEGASQAVGQVADVEIKSLVGLFFASAAHGWRVSSCCRAAARSDAALQGTLLELLG